MPDATGTIIDLPWPSSWRPRASSALQSASGEVLYLEDRRDEAIVALYAATGIDPANDTLWPNSPDGEDSVGLARMYTRLGRYDLTLLGVRAGVEKGYFCVPQFERDPQFDPIRGEAMFQGAMTLARQRHQRAAEIFTDEGGPALLGGR